jgi:hypothetical protein
MQIPGERLRRSGGVLVRLSGEDFHRTRLTQYDTCRTEPRTAFEPAPFRVIQPRCGTLRLGIKYAEINQQTMPDHSGARDFR